MNFTEMTTTELKDLLTKRGIEFSPRAQKKTLIGLLEADDADSKTSQTEEVAVIEEDQTDAPIEEAPVDVVTETKTTTKTVSKTTTNDTVVVENTETVVTSFTTTNASQLDSYMAQMNALERADELAKDKEMLG